MNETGLRDYADELFGGEDVLLQQMREEAESEGIPTIQVPVELGRLLTLFILQTGAERVLEIGTLFGYSATLMARALPPHGRITSLEVNPKHAAIARQNFERAGVADKVQILEGPGLESLSKLQGQEFDMVFIDADKQSYAEYLQWAVRLTHPRSLIVADNVWRGGSVTNPEADDAASQGIARFNAELVRNENLFSTIIPTRECMDAASVSIVR